MSMTDRSNMKKLFLAIRHGDLELVKKIIEAKPELVNCTAKQPPKKDDGQSPLQVALKTEHHEIANYLIDAGADLNFMEDKSCCNEMRQPVLFDAITNAVFCSRWNVYYPTTGLEVKSTKENFDAALYVLERMLKNGADTSAVNSYGSNAIWKFVSDAGEILPHYADHENHTYESGRVFTDELREDLTRVFRLLVEYGADVDYVSPRWKRTVREFLNTPALEIIGS